MAADPPSGQLVTPPRPDQARSGANRDSGFRSPPVSGLISPMRVAWMIGLGIACGTVAARAGVEIGDPAPRLDGSLAWLQGDPLDPGTFIGPLINQAALDQVYGQPQQEAQQ